MRRPHGGHHDTEGHDFSASVNPLGPPEGLIEAVGRSRGELHRYPYEEYARFRETVARYHDLDPASVLPSAGVGEVLSLLAHHLSGSRVQVGVPSFTEYEDMIGRVARRCERVHLPLRWNDAARVTGRFDPEDCDAVILCNPSNPVGWCLPGSAVESLLARCRGAGTLLVVDEAFVECTPDPDDYTVASCVPGPGHLLVLRSLTKLYTVPGLRVGYALGDGSLIQQLRSIQNPWPLGTGALRAGRRALDETAFARRSRRFFFQQRREVEARCRSIPHLEWIPSRVNYFLARTGRDRLVEDLADDGLFVRDASSFTGLTRGWFRFSLQQPESTRRLLTRLRKRPTSRRGEVVSG